MQEMKSSIRPFVQGNVLVLSETSSAATAARAMREQGVGSVILSSKSGDLSGIVTDRDIACRQVAYKRSAETQLSEICSKDLALISEDQSVEDAVRLMEEYGIRRIPVLETGSRSSRCIGLISLDDLIAAQAVPLSTVSQVVRSQIRRRTRSSRAEQRSQERKEQTQQRFFRILAEHMSMNEQEAEPIARYLLSNVVKRLPYSSAAHLIAQFPQNLQEDLLDLPSGPDRNITVESMERELARSYNMDAEQMRDLSARMWRGIEDFTHNQGPDKVLGQLPKEMQKLFVGDSSTTSLPSGDGSYRSELS